MKRAKQVFNRPDLISIGDLERAAGIEQTPAARSSFWQQFAHMETRASLAAGGEKLREMILARAAGGAV